MLKLTSADNRYAIVKPVLSAPRLDALWLADDEQDLIAYIADIPKDEQAVAFDLETRGTLACHKDFLIVGFGLSCSIGSIYMDVRDITKEAVKDLLTRNGIPMLPLIGHNIYFDAAGLKAYGIQFDETNWLADTYILYKQLASEGFPQQRWGLKEAMVDMLGWEDTNEAGIDEWLIANGYTNVKELGSTLDTPEKRLAKAKEKDKKGNPKLRPNKGEMWRVPAEILGRYCGLDCDATWSLFTQVLVPAMNNIPPQTWDMHVEGFIPCVGIQVDALFSGMTINTPQMSEYNRTLEGKIAACKSELLSSPLLSPHVQEYEAKWLAEIKEPNKFTKAGKLSKSWINWRNKLDKIGRGEDAKLNKDYKFNINGDEMAEVLYGHLVQYEVIKQHEGADAKGKVRILSGPEGTNVGAELDMTDSGKLPMDEAAFNQFGCIGKTLSTLAGLEKLQGYYEAALAKAIECEDERIHAQVRIHGTLTSRLAGGGNREDKNKYNVQQLPGDKEYLSCYTARQGYVLIQADVSALEPHVLAEISRDKTYMELYGPNAKSQDIYLFNGLGISRFRQAILDAGYVAGDAEAMAKAKAECKDIRNILKVLTLSSSYGAGVSKIWTTLKLQGVQITQQEVQQIYDDFWGPKLYGGVKKFQTTLEREWRDNKGWVLDGLGCAVPITEKLKKDILNRVVQGNGHRVLMLFLAQCLRPKLIEAGIDFHWYIPDLHDETIYEVRAEQAESALQIHNAAVDYLNEMLGGVTKIKMQPKVIKTLAERKDD